MLDTLDEQEFLHCLPTMRLAFTHLNTREKRQLSEALLGNNEMEYSNATYNKTSLDIQQQELTTALELRRQSLPILNLWGLEE